MASIRQQMEKMTPAERDRVATLALGRLMGLRQKQVVTAVDHYDRCRSIILAAAGK